MIKREGTAAECLSCDPDNVAHYEDLCASCLDEYERDSNAELADRMKTYPQTCLWCDDPMPPTDHPTTGGMCWRCRNAADMMFWSSQYRETF